MDITKLPHQYRLAFQHQAEIGWSNWYKGRVAITLTRLFPRQPKQKYLIPQLLSHTLRQWTTLWSLRNEIVHGHHQSSALSEKTNRIHAELRHIYSKRAQYLSKDQDILMEDISLHLKLPITSIQNWIILYKAHLSESAQLAKKFALRGVYKITRYFKKT